MVIVHLESLGGGYAFGQCGLDDLGAGEGDHAAELLPEDQAAGAQAESRGEDPVVGAGGSATLKVAKDDATSLVARLILDQLGNDVAHASESDVAEGVGLGGEGGRADREYAWSEALGNPEVPDVTQ